MLQNIKAVIFDLDGTLVDSMWVWKQVDLDYLDSQLADLELSDHHLRLCYRKLPEGRILLAKVMYIKYFFSFSK